MPINPLALLDRVILGRIAPQPVLAPALPLQGLTVLAVEDSRFASDALRLLCQRSGARLRRVDTLQAAYMHLRVYRPDVVLIDIGLPDGRGDRLIRDLAPHGVHAPVIIAISGDTSTRAEAMQAGAQDFMEKPFPSLAAFQETLLRHLPDSVERGAPKAGAAADCLADPLALHDDLIHAAALLRAGPDAQNRRYLAGFITSIARAARDAPLAAAAVGLVGQSVADADLRALLEDRISAFANPFGTAPQHPML